MLRISQAKRSFRASRMPSASLPAGPKENASFATIKLPHAPKRSDERWIFWVCYNGTGTTMLSKTLCCKKNIQKFPSVSRFVVFCDAPSDRVWGTGRETQLSKSKIRIFRIKADLDSGSVCGPTPARNLLALMGAALLVHCILQRLQSKIRFSQWRRPRNSSVLHCSSEPPLSLQVHLLDVPSVSLLYQILIKMSIVFHEKNYFCLYFTN